MSSALFRIRSRQQSGATAALAEDDIMIIDLANTSRNAGQGSGALTGGQSSTRSSVSAPAGPINENAWSAGGSLNIDAIVDVSGSADSESLIPVPASSSAIQAPPAGGASSGRTARRTNNPPPPGVIDEFAIMELTRQGSGSNLTSGGSTSRGCNSTLLSAGRNTLTTNTTDWVATTSMNDTDSYYGNLYGNELTVGGIINHRNAMSPTNSYIDCSDAQPAGRPAGGPAGRPLCACCRVPVWLLMLLQVLFITAMFSVLIGTFVPRDENINDALRDSILLLERRVLQPLQERERSIVATRRRILYSGGQLCWVARSDADNDAIMKGHANGSDARATHRWLLEAALLTSTDPYISNVQQISYSGGTIMECGTARSVLHLCRSDWHCRQYTAAGWEQTVAGTFTSMNNYDKNLGGMPYMSRLPPDERLQWHVYTYKRSEGVAVVLSLVAGLSRVNTSWRALLMEVDVSHLRGILAQDTPNVTGAHTSVFELDDKLLMFTTALPEKQHYTSAGRLWPVGEVPRYGDIDINSAYERARKQCPDECDAMVINYNNILTSVRAIKTKTGLHLLFIQEAPEDYYIGEQRSAKVRMISLGAGTIVVVAASCLVIAVALALPLRALKENFELAALMQNDKVVHTHSFLAEISDLSRAFDKMNEKLIVARAFMPQAYLEEGNEEEDDDEGDFELPDMSGSIDPSCSSIRSSIRSVSRTITEPRGSSTVGISNAKSQTLREARIAARMVLHQRKVAVLSINIRGFHRTVRDPQSLVRLSETLAQCVQECVNTHGGIVDSFHGDHFIVTFNGTRVVSLGGKRMALCAIDLRESLRNEEYDALGSVSMGAAMGPALVGSLGSSTLRRFSVVGHVYSLAMALERGSKRLQQREGGRWGPFAWCLLNAAASSEADTATVQQLVGRVQTGPRIVPVFSLITMAQQQVEDEWLYQVGGGQNDMMRLHNTAFIALLEGQLEIANRLLGEHDSLVEGEPGGVPVALLREAAQKLGNTLLILEEVQLVHAAEGFADLGNEGVAMAAGIIAWERLRYLLDEGPLPPYCTAAPAAESEAVAVDIEPA